MPTESFPALDIPAFGAPTSCSACGCGGGAGGCGSGCGGGCGGAGGAQALLLSQPNDECIEAPWTSCPPGSMPSYAAGGGSDAITQALAKVEAVRQQVLASL